MQLVLNGYLIGKMLKIQDGTKIPHIQRLRQQINQFVVFNIALKLTKQTVLIKMRIFVTNEFVNRDNLGMRGLSEAILEILAMGNEKRQDQDLL